MTKKKKKNERQKRNIMILGIVALSVVAITVAYAALSSTLNISINKVTQQALGFGPTFKINGSNYTVTPTTSATSNTGFSCGNATISNDKLTVTVADTSLSKPDDTCTYALVVENTKDITAKLSSFSITNPSGTGVSCTPNTNKNQNVCGNITYSLQSNTSGTLLPLNTTIAKNATMNVYLVIKYTGSSLNTSTVTQSGASFTLNWVQQ